LDWKASEGGDGGVFIRVPSQDDTTPWESGFEIQINAKHQDNRHCTGALYGLAAVQVRPNERADVWHQCEITSMGKAITVRIDNQETLTAHYDDFSEKQERPLRGYIGLQGSSGGPGTTIQYRNIRIQKLRPDATVPGFTLLTQYGSGWHTIENWHGTGGRWDFENGTWSGRQDPPGSGNGGILLSDEVYGDFEVIFETNPDWGVDSGFFLRSTQEGKTYQIMIDYHDRDDDRGNVGGVYGEGIGAFHMQNYQFTSETTIIPITGRINPLPFEPGEILQHWKPGAFNEIRARIRNNPPLIDVWLNGIHLTHFEDDQRRLEDTGHLGFQCHGGTGWPKEAKISFRNIQIREIAD
jgi:hypothetical protein